MDKQAKFELMQKVSRELDDLKNSQAAVIKKITQIEAQNMDLNDKELESLLAEVHEHVADNLIKVEDTAQAFHQQTERFAVENSLELEEAV